MRNGDAPVQSGAGARGEVRVTYEAVLIVSPVSLILNVNITTQEPTIELPANALVININIPTLDRIGKSKWVNTNKTATATFNNTTKS